MKSGNDYDICSGNNNIWCLTTMALVPHVVSS
jgi:hypothetical protein